MKITRIFGIVSLIVFLTGISIAVSRDVTLARESEESGNIPSSVQVGNRNPWGQNDTFVVSGDENESISSNVNVSGNHSERENDDRNEGEDGGSRSVSYTHLTLPTIYSV